MHNKVVCDTVLSPLTLQYALDTDEIILAWRLHSQLRATHAPITRNGVTRPYALLVECFTCISCITVCFDVCSKLIVYLTNEILRNANEIHFIPSDLCRANCLISSGTIVNNSQF